MANDRHEQIRLSPEKGGKIRVLSGLPVGEVGKDCPERWALSFLRFICWNASRRCLGATPGGGAFSTTGLTKDLVVGSLVLQMWCKTLPGLGSWRRLVWGVGEGIVCPSPWRWCCWCECPSFKRELWRVTSRSFHSLRWWLADCRFVACRWNWNLLLQWCKDQSTSLSYEDYQLHMRDLWVVQ